MNRFLRSLDMSFRRDEKSMRPRVNKMERAGWTRTKSRLGTFTTRGRDTLAGILLQK